GGALGNAIDRLLYGSVIDMIEPEFIDFAVFNVADSFITCGAVVLVIFLLFFDRKKKSA
ncbi:MAG: signal peptidase II, partial [Oscillospiraceae bacterium]|nr:signal peptidase II [Oscillospiraceae bacterium]